MERFTEDNYEDWDFRHTSHDDPEYDVEADLFYGTHFTTVVAVDYVRLMVIAAFLDKGLVKLDDDREHIRFELNGDALLSGWKGGASRFTSAGRFERKVVKGLRRELRKYGKLRTTIAPASRRGVAADPPKPPMDVHPATPETARESGAALYRRDRQAYVDAFWALEQRRSSEVGIEPWSEDELALVNGLAYWLGRDEVDQMPQLVATGYLAGTMEEWRDELAEHRFTTIWRGPLEAEVAEAFPEDTDREWWARLIHCVVGLSNDLERYCFDREHLNERLGNLCDSVGEKLFLGGFDAENREHWQMCFRFGVALALYASWFNLMEELGVPDDERWTDELYARPSSDTLVDLDLPMTVNGCELKREDIIGGYELRSQGALGGGHWMRFRALDETAEIVVIVTEGKLETRTMEVPEARHVQALRDLGFTQMTYPNGKRYELRTWPGVKRIRD